MPKLISLWTSLTAAALCACSADKRAATDTAIASATTPAATTPALGPGEAMLPVTGGKIWYKVSGTGTGTPVILIHGGPGMCHPTGRRAIRW